MTATARIAPRTHRSGPAGSGRRQSALTLLVLALAVLAVYFPIRTSPGDNMMAGLDYGQLHLRRLEFAESALFGPHPHLPGWYPRELLGTPFWSNIQDFPLLPTRLILLLIDPLKAYAVGVIMGAELAALFAFIFGRAIGLSRIAAAAAGWTFACSGFFAARVLAGHLPMLEVYCALPMMLWFVHRCLQAPPGRKRSIALGVLGLATTVLCFGGHPQLSAYAIVAAGGYAIWMNARRSDLPANARPVGSAPVLLSMIFGIGVAAVVLWPMALLVARSTRMLPLDPPDNDIAFPVSRLLAFIAPWRDGWPDCVIRAPQTPLRYSNASIFWETVCYVGLLPLAAAVFWLIAAFVRRRRTTRTWTFIIAAGAGGLLLALPVMHDLLKHLPGTIFRSPARLVYFTIFALALGFGAAIDRLRAAGIAKHWAIPAVGVLLVVQGLDLGSHDRCFIRTCAVTDDPQLDREATRLIGDGRAAIDGPWLIRINRQVDDVGYFDSVALAKPYQALIDLAGEPPKWNSQYIEGSDLNRRTLALCGVRFMLTEKLLPGQEPTSPDGITHPQIIRFTRYADRVDFFPLASTIVADVPTIHERLRDPDYDLMYNLLIPIGSPAPRGDAATEALPPAISYTRDSQDTMTISATVPQSGYLRIDEAWDPGWHATVDGKPVPLVAGDDVFLTLPLSPGHHKVGLEFSTPGAVMGWIISLACLGALMWIAWQAGRPMRKG